MPNSPSPMGLGHLIFLAAFENLCQVPVCRFRYSKTFVSLSCGVWSVWVRAELQQIPSGDSYLGLNLSWAASGVRSPAEGHHMSFVILLYSTFGRFLMGEAAGQSLPHGPCPESIGSVRYHKKRLCCQNTPCAVGFLANLAHSEHCCV